MKKLFIPFSIVLVLTSCATSYYEAGRKNVNRFDGDKQKDAEYLLKLNDELMLLENVSTQAREKTDSKHVYLLSDFIADEVDDKYLKIELLAKSRRIALASELSKESDDRLHEIIEMPRSTFDSVYLKFASNKMSSIESMLEEYNNTGKDESIVNLSEDITETINRSQAKLREQREKMDS